MDNSSPSEQLSFRVHFIRMDTPERGLTVKVLLVERHTARPVYESLGTWSQCKRWVAQISKYAILGSPLIAIRKRLELNQLATIGEMRASLSDIESAGFSRVDCSAPDIPCP